MENISAVTSFILTAYTELEDHRYLYFTCFLLVYILTILANSGIFVVIFIDRGLHEPMYLFICNLAVNQIYGSTSLLPPILCNLLSDNYEISLTICLVQIFCIHLYSSTEFTILAVMSYDRYVAICHPLHYHLLMSHRKVCTLISMSWIYPCTMFGLYFILTVQRTFCDRYIDKMFCINFALVRLSCFEISFQSIVGLFVEGSMHSVAERHTWTKRMQHLVTLEPGPDAAVAKNADGRRGATHAKKNATI
ncbi:olfactory receptor 1M1-like [Conger conger]|uniref:olfactory receptor 1M1-like n=1 Tax=Conger conger TaxID=82655 RepID=UPI002A5AA98F|nr:olfactory receptor 1M1-like [Conger conger]